MCEFKIREFKNGRLFLSIEEDTSYPHYESVWVTDVWDAYRLLSVLVEFIKLKEIGGVVNECVKTN